MQLCGSEQVDDVLDGMVGFVIGKLEFAVGGVSWIGSVVKAAVGQGTAETLVEEQKQERYLNPFGGEPVGIAGAIALEQTVALKFAQIVAELVEAVGFGGKLKGDENGLVDLFGGPAAEGRAAMQENFQ